MIFRFINLHFQIAIQFRFLYSYERTDQCFDKVQDSESLALTPANNKKTVGKGDAALNEKSALCPTSDESNIAGSSNSNHDYEACGTDRSSDNSPLLSSAEYGTVKKSVLTSRFGFLFQWTTKYEAGNVPLYSLLLAIFCSTMATILLLFVSFEITQWWFITLLIILILTTILCLMLITAFNQDNSIRTFKVSFLCFRI